MYIFDINVWGITATNVGKSADIRTFPFLLPNIDIHSMTQLQYKVTFDLCVLTWHGRPCSTLQSHWTAAFWSSQHAPCNYESSAEVKPKKQRKPVMSIVVYECSPTTFPPFIPPSFLFSSPQCVAGAESCTLSWAPTHVPLTCRLKQDMTMLSLWLYKKKNLTNGLIFC